MFKVKISNSKKQIKIEKKKPFSRIDESLICAQMPRLTVRLRRTAGSSNVSEPRPTFARLAKRSGAVTRTGVRPVQKSGANKAVGGRTAAARARVSHSSTFIMIVIG